MYRAFSRKFHLVEHVSKCKIAPTYTAMAAGTKRKVYQQYHVAELVHHLRVIAGVFPSQAGHVGDLLAVSARAIRE